MTSTVAGHGTGPNGQQPIDLSLAQGHQLIPLLVPVGFVECADKPVTGWEQIGNGDPEMDADGRGMFKVKKGGRLVIQPAANRRGGNMDHLASGSVGHAMAFQHSTRDALCENNVGSGEVGFLVHGAPPVGARARGRDDCQI